MTCIKRILTAVLFRIIKFQFLTNNVKITIGYKIVILRLLSHECETWPHILREEHRLRVKESKLFQHKAEKVR
jgi:hypothetical protein